MPQMTAPANTETQKKKAAKKTAPDAMRDWPRRGRVMAVGGVVQAVLQRQGGAEIALLAALMPHWRGVVPSVHPWCWPVGLQRGVLAVAVANDSVRQQLHYEAPGIIAMLDMVLGAGRVKSLRYVPAPPRDTPTDRVAAHVPSRPPAEGVAKADRLCKSVADADLQVALAALGSYLLHPTQEQKR
jgi:hypothetical protein